MLNINFLPTFLLFVALFIPSRRYSSIWCHFPSTWRISFNISNGGSPLIMNLLVLLFPLGLKELLFFILEGYFCIEFHVDRFFFFEHLKESSYFTLAYIAFYESLSLFLSIFSLFLFWSFFSSVALKFFISVPVYSNLWFALIWFSFCLSCLELLDIQVYSFHQMWQIWGHYFFNIFLDPFPPPFVTYTTIMIDPSHYYLFYIYTFLNIFLYLYF